MSDTDVLVVGAGPTGLVLAAELRRHGVQPRIVDQNPTPLPVSRAVAIHVRTLEIFDQMGLASKLVDAGHRIHGANVYAAGKRLLRFSFEELDSPFRFALDIPQTETERILEARLKALGVLVERNVTVTGLQQTDSEVEVFLQKPRALTERSQFRYVVGCDGAHSTVRHAASLPLEGPRTPEFYVTADIRLQGASIAEDEWHVFLGEEGVLTCSPLGGGRYRLIADGRLFADTEPETVRSAAAGVLSAEVELESASPWRIHSRRVSEYRSGRIFLAGDAAHVYSPAGGQGMNSAIQDAHNLAWKLALAVHGKASEALLDSYAVERQEASRSVLELTEQLLSVANLESTVSQRIRNRLLPVLAGFEVFSNRLARQLSEVALNYRRSPIVAGSGRWYAPGPAPGDRAVDTPLPDGTRLFDLLRGTCHTILLFAAEHPGAEDLRAFANIDRYMREGYPEDTRTLLVSRSPLSWDSASILDLSGAVHRPYGAGVPCVYVIRPDGYIGLRSLPPDPLPVLEFFGRIFEPVPQVAVP